MAVATRWTQSAAGDMGVTLNRYLGPEHDLPCGQFTLDTPSGRAALSCPLCGLVFSLPSHCRTEPDGRVVPAVKCPQVSCSFFEYVTLSDHWLTDEECRR